MIDFTGRVALVTGAGRGLGYAYAELLAKRGCVVVIYDAGTDSDGVGTDPTVAESAAAKLRRAGLFATPAAGMLERRYDCQKIVEQILSAHGRLDVVIHNAGWVGYQRIEALDENFLARMTSLSIDASLWLSQAAWPAMVRQSYGRILLTTSDRAIYPQYAQAGLAAYAAAKMATIGVMNVLAREGDEHGIFVNAISPVAKTRMWGIDGEPDELSPGAVAAGAAFLVSDACCSSGWVLRASNGQFHALKACDAAGVDYPRDLKAVTAATPEEIAAQWRRIAPTASEART